MCLKIILLATDRGQIAPCCVDLALPYDEMSLQPLCKACHSRKTAKKDGGFGNPKQS